MRILTIFTRFGTEKYATAEQELDKLFAARLPDVVRDVIVVDTAMTAGVVEQNGRRTLLGSDNDAWEFSAIDTAVRFVGNRLWTYDLVNVATSAFRQLYVGYLERFTPAVLDAIEGRPICLGHIDCYNEPIRVLEYASQHWIRTSCFFLPRPSSAFCSPCGRRAAAIAGSAAIPHGRFATTPRCRPATSGSSLTGSPGLTRPGCNLALGDGARYRDVLRSSSRRR